MKSLDKKIEEAIENLADVPVPGDVLERLLKQMYKPRYSFGHLLLLLLVFTIGEIVFAKSFLQSPFTIMVYFLFGIFTLLWTFLWSYLMILERQTKNRDFGKKLNQILDHF